jgi:hypothetical protein
VTPQSQQAFDELISSEYGADWQKTFLVWRMLNVFIGAMYVVFMSGCPAVQSTFPSISSGLPNELGA